MLGRSRVLLYTLPTLTPQRARPVKPASSILKAFRMVLCPRSLARISSVLPTGLHVASIISSLSVQNHPLGCLHYETCMLTERFARLKKEADVIPLPDEHLATKAQTLEPYYYRDFDFTPWLAWNYKES